MEIVLERVQLDPDVTIGSLSVDGDFSAWVCEDTVREVPGQSVYQWKVKGKTAIPYGTYDVKVTFSNRFKRDLPLLLNVPGFDGVRIHPGNTAEDTEGCLLPGLDRMGKSVGRSRAAFDPLFTQIKEALAKGERVTIEIC
jgi:hypothetical protein